MNGEARSGQRKYSTVSVLNWFGTLIVMMIPVVNLVMAIVWAATSKRQAKRSFAIASLILMIVLVALSFAAIALFGEQISKFLLELDFTQFKAVTVGA